jgi:branched-chain amino acid transport system substrate-binding protein
MINGASIAIDQFNAANPGCQVKFDTTYDSQGDPTQATPLATTIANDKSIIGLIGPAFSGETKATMPTFETAGLPMITPGATNALLSTNGWKMFHRILANDDKQAPGVVQLITGTIKGTKVGVIDDASDYGKGLAASVRKGLGKLDVVNATIDPKAADYSSAVTAMKDAGVDTVFYGGYYAEAAKMVQQLRDAGVKATFVSGDGSLDVGFINNAGKASEGAYLSATGAPPDVNPAFAEKFLAKFKVKPTLYSPEAYDSANVFLAGIAAGKVTRADMATFVSAYDAAGITKHIKFDATGEPAGSAVFYTLVTGGKLVSKGLVPS